MAESDRNDSEKWAGKYKQTEAKLYLSAKANQTA
jgi:hypothetical protein